MTKIKDRIVISDLHCGCTLGLFPGKGITLTDGLSYKPTSIQKKLWLHWKEFWNKWVPKVTQNRPYSVVLNGDSMDGVHHGTKKTITNNFADQISIAAVCLVPVVEACEGRFILLTGTPVHGGECGEYDELLALRLGAMPDLQGRYARDLLRDYVGDLRVHTLHTVGRGRSTLRTEMYNAMATASQLGLERPDVIVRSHIHQYSHAELPGEPWPVHGVVTPAWQAFTPLCYRIQGARTSIPQFGGVHIHDTGNGARIEAFVKNIKGDGRYEREI